MKVFIPSSNRADIIRTHNLFAGSDVDWHVVLHSDLDLDLYLKASNIPRERFLVTNTTKGMSVARQAILDQFVAEDEWVMMMDDNINSITGLPPAYYEMKHVEAKKFRKTFAELFQLPVTIPEFMLRAYDTINQAERVGARYAGFASNANHFFREDKWKYCGYVIGKCIMIKKGRLRYDQVIQAMDDFAFTALNLKEYGVVCINQFVSVNKKHYEQGGVGKYDERLALKTADAEYLITKFRGLFAYNPKPGHDPRAELKLRLSTPKQIALWRQQFTIHSSPAEL
jgi:hypothetical protein